LPHPTPNHPTPLQPTEKSRAGWITKINLYHDGKCITGVKPTYGYSAKDAKLLGSEKGAVTHIDLSAHKGEFVTQVDVIAGE